MSQIGNELRQWAETNDFYENGILSNGLKLNRLAAERIRRIIIELEYHGRDRLAKRLEAEFSEIVEKCHSLDMARVKGCFTEDQYMLLDLKRRKIIGAVFEVAELVEMVERNQKSDSRIQTTNKNEWITLAEAGRLLVVSKSTICRWADKGRFTDNGKSGRSRRLLKSSVALVKQLIEDEDIQRDAQELRRDDPKF